MTPPRAATALVLLLLLPVVAQAGAFIFASSGAPDVITHPTGYVGSGGVAAVTVCIDPASSNASAMETPIRNVVRTWNALAAASPNLRRGASNDVPSGMVDFESIAVHEVGHCIGLAHPNLASESGVPSADSDYTRGLPGPNGRWDLDPGPDGVPGSGDDRRGDDDGLHWFHTASNDPFGLPSLIDLRTFSRRLADLPTGHTFAANADRAVGALLGVPDTEAVMQQGSYSDEDQRRLAADDVATMRLAMSGLDGMAGTADDYVLGLVYGGLATGCDVTVAFDDAETGFAVCQVSGTYLRSNHARITRGSVYFNSGFSWYFNQVAASPPSTSTTSTSSSSSSSSSTSSTHVTTSTTSSSSSSTSAPPPSSTSSSTAPPTSSTSTTSTTTSTTTSSSTTSTTVQVDWCDPAPRTDCLRARRAVVRIDETRPGRERLSILLRRFENALETADLGNPTSGETWYAACLYDAADRLAGGLRVDRPGERCGRLARPCWRRTPAPGFRYADPDLAAHGVRKLLLRSGRAGSGRVALAARNDQGRGRASMPTGLAAALAGSGRATVQMVTPDTGACFDTEVTDVRIAAGAVFKALGRSFTDR